MNMDRQKALKYAARLCIIGVLALVLLKFVFRMNIGINAISIFALCVVANSISYLLYKPK